MKLIRTFGLAVMAAVAAMAFLGASSAMAEPTQLCASHPAADESCSNPATSVHFVSVDHDGDGDKHALLLTNVLDVECESLVSGTVLGLASPQVAHAEVVYSNCLGICDVNTEENGLISGLKEGFELASLTATGYKVHVVCGIVINCTYTAQGLVGHGEGPLLAGGNGRVTYEEDVVKGTGIACPSVAELDAVFESLTPVYVAK